MDILYNSVKRFFIPALILIFLSGFTGIPQDDEYEIRAVKKKLKSFDSSLSEIELYEIIAEVGKSFLGVEYVAGTLDNNIKEEKLVIKITGLDCVTFVENTLAISRIIRKGKIDYDSYRSELQNIRYRNGEINGYASRLHYFSDWIYDNQKKGIVEDITGDIGGESYKKNIDFMSSHVDSYKQLKNNPGLVDEIIAVENDINGRKMYYIRKDKVDDYYDSMQTGDIIATTTKIDGLDITHTGFVYKENGKVKFMHASITKGEIVISSESLKDYLSKNSKQSGIMVVRPL
ncbi:MAG: DUF1460 domain-containing protein [Ignavibacteria bacterium]|nr:DUF1460 domain-containing protein [Ignavibacteria bacterium]